MGSWVLHVHWKIRGEKRAFLVSDGSFTGAHPGFVTASVIVSIEGAEEVYMPYLFFSQMKMVGRFYNLDWNS